MSFLRALRAYVGLGPDEEVEGRYLEELNARRRELELEEIGSEPGAESRSSMRSTMIEGRASARPNGPTRSNSGTGGPRRRRPAGERQADSVSSGQRSRGAATGVSRPWRHQQVDDRPRRANGRRRSDEPDSPEIAPWGEESPFDEIDEEVLRQPAEDLVDDDAPRGWRGHAIDVSSTGEVDLTAVEFDDDLTIDLRTIGEHDASLPERHKEGAGAVVRSLDVMRSKPKTVLPESFADAKDVADEFKRRIPIVLNLQSVDRELARRLIDFASGVCYSLDGSMEKLASQVFLLVPEDVEVSEHDRRLIVERGYAR